MGGPDVAFKCYSWPRHDPVACLSHLFPRVSIPRPLSTTASSSSIHSFYTSSSLRMYCTPSHPEFEPLCSIRAPPCSAPDISAPSLAVFALSATALTIQLQSCGVLYSPEAPRRWDAGVPDAWTRSWRVVAVIAVLKGISGFDSKVKHL